MPGYHRTEIIGHLGRDPEIRHINDNSVCQFSVAVTEKWRDKSGEQQEHTEWYNVDVWGAMGEACAKYLAKGRAVFCAGKLRTREYEKDGEKKRFTTLRAQHVQFLGGGPSERKPEPEAPADDDVPF